MTLKGTSIKSTSILLSPLLIFFFEKIKINSINDNKFYKRNEMVVNYGQMFLSEFLEMQKLNGQPFNVYKGFATTQKL